MVDQPTRTDWISVIALGVIWGGAFFSISMALEGYGPLTVAALRTALASSVLLIVARATGRRFPRRDPALWKALTLIGIFSSAIPFFLLSWGQQFVPSAFAGISMSSVPLFVIPLAHMFSDEKAHLRKFIGVCMGFMGAVILIGPGLVSSGQADIPVLAGLACIGAAFCYAVSSVMTRQCPPIDPILLTGLSLGISAVFLVPAMLVFEGTPVWQSGRSSIALIYLGIIPTGLAMVIRARIIVSAGSVFMTLVNYQVPLWSMLLGAIVLSEALPFRFFLALIVILAGLLTSQWFSLKRLFGNLLTRR
ncbi:MAG: DMT family transporter [Marinosulfonomonas sp.]|nr:DMT family transporter [Marinosulfonomonas sp.]